MEQEQDFASYIFEGCGFKANFYSKKEAFILYRDYTGDAKLYGIRQDGSRKLLKMKTAR